MAQQSFYSQDYLDLRLAGMKLNEDPELEHRELDPIVDPRRKSPAALKPISPPMAYSLMYSNNNYSNQTKSLNGSHSAPGSGRLMPFRSPSMANSPMLSVFGEDLSPRITPLAPLPPPMLALSSDTSAMSHNNICTISSSSSISSTSVPSMTPRSASSSPSSFRSTPAKPVSGDKKVRMNKEAISRFQGLKINDFRGKIVRTSKDQYGCRYLQYLIDCDRSCIDLILEECDLYMAELMIDPFANYLCQKLIETVNDFQLQRIIRRLSPDLVNISRTMHGTRSVQKMVEYIRNPAQMAMIEKAIGRQAVDLMQDLNGNHVIQKCLMRFTEDHSQFIYDQVCVACVEIATHKHGCCVFQRCLDFASGDYQRDQLVRVVIKNLLDLICDPYGNYVVQYILDLKQPRYTQLIVQAVKGNVFRFSLQKFSSNVVEKCIKADTQFRYDLIEEVAAESTIYRLISDSYGNYVVQTSLELANDDQKARMAEAVRAASNTPNGKRLLRFLLFV